MNGHDTNTLDGYWVYDNRVWVITGDGGIARNVGELPEGWTLRHAVQMALADADDQANYRVTP